MGLCLGSDRYALEARCEEDLSGLRDDIAELAHCVRRNVKESDLKNTQCACLIIELIVEERRSLSVRSFHLLPSKAESGSFLTSKFENRLHYHDSNSVQCL